MAPSIPTLAPSIPTWIVTVHTPCHQGKCLPDNNATAVRSVTTWKAHPGRQLKLLVYHILISCDFGLSFSNTPLPSPVPGLRAPLWRSPVVVAMADDVFSDRAAMLSATESNASE